MAEEEKLTEEVEEEEPVHEGPNKPNEEE